MRSRWSTCSPGSTSFPPSGRLSESIPLTARRRSTTQVPGCTSRSTCGRPRTGTRSSSYSSARCSAWIWPPRAGLDPGERIHDKIFDALLGKLTSTDVLTKKTARDAVNSQVTTWLLGGVADDDHNTDQNNTVIHDIGLQNANPEFGIPEDSLVIAYTGSQHAFVPAAPAGWPTATAPSPAYDFSPGTLASIDHIVVLTMENRSFDHMLGYLSLARDRGGEGRTDVDGLTGTESNTYRGTTFPVVPADRDDLRARSAARVRARPQGHQRRRHGRLRQQFRGRARRQERRPDHGPPHGRHRARLRRHGPRLRHRPSVVREPPRPDLRQPVLRADRPPQPRSAWLLGVRRQPDPARVHPDDLRLPDWPRPDQRPEAHLDLLRARLLLPALLRGPHVRPVARGDRR